MARPRTPAPPAPPAPPPAARRVTHGAEPARAGFVLYVGLQGDPPDLDAGHVTELAEVAEALRDLARDLLPTAETFTALSVVPAAAAPDDVRDLRARLAALRPLEDGAAARPAGA